MVDKPVPPDPEDQDNWESLAKDLFGVEFDSPPPTSDDLDDELLNDDFLREGDESPAPPAEFEDATETEESDGIEEQVVESVAPTQPEEAKSAEQLESAPDEDLDVLLDFSQPYGDETEEALPVAEGSEEPDLFEKLAAEVPEIDEEQPGEEDGSLDSADEADADEQRDSGDFWDVLENFADEELGTPHIDHGQSRGGKPPRDPEIGLVSGSPENQAGGAAAFETSFESESDFGLGILEDAETDEVDESDDPGGDDSGAGEGTGDEAPKRKRRRRRRRRGGRRKKTTASASEEESSEDDVKQDAPREKNSDDAELSRADAGEDELDEEEDDRPRASGSSRYQNVPTWSEAIELIVDRKVRSGSENRGRRSSRGDAKNRKRGGRRRRSRKSNS